ncbi:hypothetical protein [Photorhabdus caribbeanensis]|uniref:hypothetical protein n=1 Tax=Photorhabdus caribbeanensis TaxID=1004165 RepID=UPI001BD39B69|nr:hypothetical protein [Photorhabdus caribbeanensis]MBS9423024.1 hypothetical protein [Photorhabdus caribbeanensis]
MNKPKENNMKINVASIRQATFRSEFSLDRESGQSIQDYLSKEIERRIDLVRENILLASENKEKNIPLFFSLPEFFWNIKWNTLKNKDELYQLTDYMMHYLSDAQESLMNSLPESEVGKIVLLAGTMVVLVETSNDGVFEPLNYCLISNNFKKKNDGRFERSMWPKRTTSHIDFGLKDKVTNNGFIFTFADKLTVEVLNKTQHVGEHDNNINYGFSIDNNIINDCPFSINLCLDYGRVKPGERNDELIESSSKIDFLLACGMSLSPNYKYPPSVRFAVRNDGMRDGKVECFSIKNRHLFKKIPQRELNTRLSMVELTL